ncbi:MAG: DUF1289 domain-containing protein [Burkholderiaceae bacterium]
MNEIEKLARRVRLNPQGEPPSPCLSVCIIGADNGWCQGCFRTIEEVAAWPELDRQAKREVWLRIEQRVKTIAA